MRGPGWGPIPGAGRPESGFRLSLFGRFETLSLQRSQDLLLAAYVPFLGQGLSQGLLGMGRGNPPQGPGGMLANEWERIPQSLRQGGDGRRLAAVPQSHGDIPPVTLALGPA